MHKSRCHRQPCIDIRFLCSNPAEIVQAWKPDMLDYEIEFRKIGRCVIDVADVERIQAQRINSWPLMDVDVLDPKLLRQLQILICPGVVKPPTSGRPSPFGRI